VPFYLLHPRLRRLERSQMLEVEGGTRGECLRILRHEAGHAIQHAYGLHRRRRWRELFGRSGDPYPSHYRPNPNSRHFVRHLRLWYAQAHPAEDFAETFAVWLRPAYDWRQRYAGWPALAKLEYVDELMAEIAPTSPGRISRRTVEPLHRIRKTLREHYEARRAFYDVGFPRTHDRDLRRLFAEGPARAPSAAGFLRRHRRELREMVAKWTGEHQGVLDLVLGQMIGRCRELGLRAAGPERTLKLDLAMLLTVKAMRFLYSGRRRFWIAL